MMGTVVWSLVCFHRFFEGVGDGMCDIPWCLWGLNIPIQDMFDCVCNKDTCNLK